MQNVILAWPSIMEGATADHLNGLGGDFSPANVLTQQPGDCYRGAASGTRIYVSLAKAEEVELFALIGTNLSPFATWSVAAGNSLEQLKAGTFQYASASQDMPEFASLDVLGTPTLDYNFINDSYQYGLRPRANIHAFMIPSPAQTYRHFLFAIQDPVNPDGFIQVGRVYLAKKFQPVSNMWAGAERGFDDQSMAMKARSGAVRIDPYGINRTLRFDLKLASEAEMRTKMYEIESARGASGDVFCIMDADQTTYLQQDMIYGVMRDLRPIIRPEMPLYSKGYTIAELPVGFTSNVWDPNVDLTVTRAGTATRIGPTGYIEDVAADTARIDHDPITLQRRGLLVEEAFTNRALYSEQFDNAAWIKANGSVTPNSIISPDGTVSMDLFTVTATSAGGANLYQTVTTTASVRQEASFFFKKFDTDHACITISDGSGNGIRYYFNLNTGAIGSITVVGSGISNVSSRMEAFPNGVYRCIVTWLQNASTSILLEAYPTVDANNSIGVTAGRRGYVWGAQVGVANHPGGSYVRTTSAVVTRARDVITLSASTLLNTSEFTLYSEIVVPQVDQNVHRHGAVLHDGSANNKVRSMWSGGTTNIAESVDTAGVAQYAVNSTVVLAAGTVFKHAIRVKTNDCRGCVNGTLSPVDSGGLSDMPVGLVTLNFGGRNAGVEPTSGWVRRVEILARGATDSQLQSLTL